MVLDHPLQYLDLGFSANLLIANDDWENFALKRKYFPCINGILFSLDSVCRTLNDKLFL